MPSEAEIKMVQMAYDAGCPEDQLKGFLSRQYVPLPWQWKFHAAAREADKEDGPTKIGAGGARGPGKSHAVFSQVIEDCLRVPDLKCLFLRKTGKSAQESFEDLISKTVRGRTKYQYISNVLRIENGSRVLMGGFRNDKDVDEYIGIEYDVIVVEELNLVTKSRIDKLLGSLRTSKPNWRPRFYASFNPGGIGHAFVKKLFVEPYRKGQETNTRFIPSTYKDNPFLNKEYIDYLEGLTGRLAKAWREGSWDIFEGQYFEEWNFDIHTIEPFKIPDYYQKYICLDYGWGNQGRSAVYWVAIDEDGRLIHYRELYAKGLDYEVLCDKVIELNVDKVKLLIPDPAFCAKHNNPIDGKKKSGAEVFARRGFNIIPGNNNRLMGWTEMRRLMKPYEGMGKQTAKLLFFKTCHNAIRTIPELIYDEKNIGDVDTAQLDENDVNMDDCADSIRYGLMSRYAKTPKQLSNIQKKMAELQEKMEGEINKEYL